MSTLHGTRHPYAIWMYVTNSGIHDVMPAMHLHSPICTPDYLQRYVSPLRRILMTDREPRILTPRPGGPKPSSGNGRNLACGTANRIMSVLSRVTYRLGGSGGHVGQRGSSGLVPLARLAGDEAGGRDEEVLVLRLLEELRRFVAAHAHYCTAASCSRPATLIYTNKCYSLNKGYYILEQVLFFEQG